ncbi:hypothetical protein B0H15DRAFT_862761 [Mycena belliarum]|uniref:BTB domain-containing protein n=1 Tax=Mycena belliarum TaxID=1033014 RepID=A0AAD6XKA7_9AGAR|nr:hypothetical protein B0H15DRAFT_862761 [Mycena belliae]
MSDGSPRGLTPPPVPPLLPQAPFDDPSADVILRTSDGMDLRVHRLACIARLQADVPSPVFRQMFQLPQPQCEPDVPIVSMTESALVLDRLLRFFYPGTEPTAPDDLEQLREILDVALRKYDMASLAVLGRHYLRLHIGLSPVGVYAIACRYEWKDVALEAAKESLKYRLRIFGTTPPVQLQHITADRYHSLLDYHAQCSQVTRAATSSLTWLTYSGDRICFTCSQGPRPKHLLLADGAAAWSTQWFADYLQNAGGVLGKTPAAKLDSTSLLDGPLRNLAKCSVCSTNGFQQLMDFARDTLPEQIALRIDAVELKLNF